MFEKIAPEECGVRSEWVENMLDEFADLGLMMHSFILLRHGKIYAEGYYNPFGVNDKHRMYSTSKSFAATAIAVLIKDGKVGIDDPIIKYFPDKTGEEVQEYLQKTTIRNLLCMQSPHCGTTYRGTWTDWIGTFFNQKANHPAGTLFSYDTSASYLLNVIVERVTCKPFLEYLKDSFFREAGFSEDAWCIKSPDGYSWGGSGVICTSRDMAMLAQLYLDKGKINGKQVIPEWYAKEAISPMVDNNISGVTWKAGNGYGYQIWHTAKNSFTFSGMAGQYAIGFPEKDALFICTGDNQSIVNNGYELIFPILWYSIISKMQDEPFEKNDSAVTHLKNRVNSLKCHLPKGNLTSQIEEINGQWYKLDRRIAKKISEIMIEWKDGKGIFHYIMNGEEKQIPFGIGDYEIGEFPQTNYFGDVIGTPSGRKYRCMSAGAWPTEYQFVLRIFIIDDYFGTLTVIVGFKDDEIGICMTAAAEWFLDEYQGITGGRKIAQNEVSVNV